MKWMKRGQRPTEPGFYWIRYPQFPETDDEVIWIYGWLKSGAGLYAMATTQPGETIFKRLSHRGYRGRLTFFVLFFKFAVVVLVFAHLRESSAGAEAVHE